MNWRLRAACRAVDAYERTTLVRRGARRMTQLGIAGHTDYQDHLRVRPDEFTALFNIILINVTGFFRDPEASEYMRDAIVRGDTVAYQGRPVRGSRNVAHTTLPDSVRSDRHRVA